MHDEVEQAQVHRQTITINHITDMYYYQFTLQGSPDTKNIASKSNRLLHRTQLLLQYGDQLKPWAVFIAKAYYPLLTLDLCIIPAIDNVKDGKNS
jgi:hypothetical protein